MILLLSSVQSKVPSSFIQDVIVAPARCQTKNRNPITYTFISRSWRDHSRLLDLRGGSEEEEESDDESDQGDEQGETDGGLDLTSVLESAANITQSTLIPYTQKAVIVMFKITKKAAITTVKAIQRAIQAGMEGEGEVEEQEDEEVSMVQKVVTTIQRMVKAAFTFPEEEQEEPDSEMSTSDAVEEEGTTEVESEDDEVVEAPPKSTSKVTKDEIPPVSKASDFGTYLATAYGVKDTRVAESGALVLGGSLTTALQEARAQARLLVIFLPAEKPNKKTTDTKEFIAIESILSQEVGEAANQRARSKGEDTGSFLFWGAKAGSSEASTAMKRLKVKPKSSKGGKIPTLMVVYPAMVSKIGCNYGGDHDAFLIIFIVSRWSTPPQVNQRLYPKSWRSITAVRHLPRQSWSVGWILSGNDTRSNTLTCKLY